MESLKQKLNQLLKLIGFRDAGVEIDPITKKVSIIVDEDEWFKKWIPDLVRDFKNLVNLMARKDGITELFHVDINNYRKEREKLIIEIAKAAAQKALTSKQEVRLPAMNAYERRIIHVELSMRPDVKTESVGEGKERSVVIKPL